MTRQRMARLESDLAAWCDSLVERSRVTAVAAIVSRGEERVEARGGEARSGAALLDLASLTKPLTATLALTLHASGELPLSTRVGDLWPQAGSLAAVGLEGLLRHESGLRRWMPLYATCDDREQVIDRLIADDWVVPGQGPQYSDLDYVLWRLSAERALGRSYLGLLRERVLEPLRIAEVRATPHGGEDAARCLLSTRREVELAAEAGLEIDELPAPARGEAQDGNCRFLGGPGGHAGLFASAAAVWRVAREWCRPQYLFSRAEVEGALSGPERYALGWFRSSETATGRRLGSAAVGHDGFTGGTLWIDPVRDLILVALAHRASLDVDLSEERAVLADWITSTEAGSA